MSKLIHTKTVRIFLTSLLLTFLMVTLPHLGFNRPAVKDLITPKVRTVDLLDQLKPKLLAKPNSFRLQKTGISSAYAGADYERSSAYTVVDLENGQVILSKNLSKRLPIASLTKVMSAMVALDLADPKEQFLVSTKAQNQIPSKVQLKAGEKYHLEALLKFLLITSANDSAIAIKEGIDSKFTEGTFIKAMNFKAQSLGLKNTHFTNPAGFDSPEHYSSVEDLSILSAYALKQYPLIAEITSKEFEDLTGGVDFRFYLNNWNGLLGLYPGVSGVKIGNTGSAGHTTIVASERGGKKLLATLLGAPGVLERDLWTSQLLDFGFQIEAGLEPVKLTEGSLKQKYSSWVYY